MNEFLQKFYPKSKLSQTINLEQLLVLFKNNATEVQREEFNKSWKLLFAGRDFDQWLQAQLPKNIGPEPEENGFCAYFSQALMPIPQGNFQFSTVWGVNKEAAALDKEMGVTEILIYGKEENNKVVNGEHIWGFHSLIHHASTGLYIDRNGLYDEKSTLGKYSKAWDKLEINIDNGPPVMDLEWLNKKNTEDFVFAINSHLQPLIEKLTLNLQEELPSMAKGKEISLDF